jgi:DNA-binding transcriptional ArsR family regulator
MAGDELAQIVYHGGPVLLLFGDDEVGLGRARAAAERAGCRVSEACSIVDAEARLERQAKARAVIVVADQPSEALDRLLARLHIEACGRRVSSIILAPEAMVDDVTRPGLSLTTDHLIDADDNEVADSIARATKPAPPRFQEVGRDPGAALLQQLSRDAARLASMLASLSSDEPGTGNGLAMPVDAKGDAPIEPGFVRSIIRVRRMRDQYFRGELFADPAWDMLLDLYAARLEKNRVAVSSLCIAAAVPATTALRWIKALTDRGLLVRTADPQDGRRVYIELSDEAAQAMSGYLSMAQRVASTII